MYLAGSRVNIGDVIAFQYVHGNERPYIDDIQGLFRDIKKTVGGLELIHVDVYSLNGKVVSGITHKLFWVHLMVNGSINILGKGANHE